MAGARGGVQSLPRCPRRATTVHAAPGGLRSLAEGAVGTSDDQQPLLQPSWTNGKALLALVIVGGRWILVGPGPYSLAIGGAVHTVIAMAENGQPGAVNALMLSWGSECTTEVLWIHCGVGSVAQEQ